jgi:hypothetical protein
MQKKYNVYHNLGYWFLLWIVLVFGGFYTSYFSVFFQPRPTIIHIHFLLMALWILMLIAQPFLIKYKKLAIHRLLGKISYVLVPLVLFFSFLMIRLEYYGHIEELSEGTSKGLNHFTSADILKKAANGPIALIYFIWFALFYVLAIVNRHKSPVHARYMLATALTLLGPTVDRILAIEFHMTDIAGILPLYAGSFLIADAILAFLLMKDYNNKKPIKTLAICLIIYIVGQVLFFIVPNFDWWASAMAYIMKPAP